MPLYPVNDFLADFIQVIEYKKKLNKKLDEKDKLDYQIQLDEFLRLAAANLGNDGIENKIAVITIWLLLNYILKFYSFLDNQIPSSFHPFRTTK